MKTSKRISDIIERSCEVDESLKMLPDLTGSSDSIKRETMKEVVADLARDLINQRCGDVKTLQTTDYILAIKLSIRNAKTNADNSAKGYEEILTISEYKHAIELGGCWFEIDCLQDALNYANYRLRFFDRICEKSELDEQETETRD